MYSYTMSTALHKERQASIGCTLRCNEKWNKTDIEAQMFHGFSFMGDPKFRQWEAGSYIFLKWEGKHQMDKEGGVEKGV